MLLGLRSSEVLQRQNRDVDAGAQGVLFWVPEGKTKESSRYLEVPSPIDELLIDQVDDRDPRAWLFPSGGSSSGHREKTWLLKNVRRICRAADVPVVSVHGLRGTWATLTTDAGIASHTVAKELGHTSFQVTRQHYAERGSPERARARKMLKVVNGGKQ